MWRRAPWLLYTALPPSPLSAALVFLALLTFLSVTNDLTPELAHLCPMAALHHHLTHFLRHLLRLCHLLRLRQ